MDYPMIFLKMLVFTKIRQLGNHNIIIMKSDPENMVGGYHCTDILDIADSFRRIVPFPCFGDNGVVVYFYLNLGCPYRELRIDLIFLWVINFGHPHALNNFKI